jgi:queuine/archaeosine tRNA-ribosyltransferase
MGIERPASLNLGGRVLPTPVFFPSISSVKTALRPLDYLRFLSSATHLNGQFLISAFDLAQTDNADSAEVMLATARKSGAFILMDSGNYESFWKDSQAKWTQSAFHDALGTFPCDLAFAFDEQEPPTDIGEHLALIVTRLNADQQAKSNSVIIPIIHGIVGELPMLCASVAESTGVTMVAVPERRLGDGVLARAQTVSAIRHELDKTGRYVALHLLGTGNPISIAIYSVLGADSFDGLEWCQTVVDFETGLLFHLSQFDFFEKQSLWADPGLSFHANALMHNLEFYVEWTRRLNSSIHRGNSAEFCRHNFPEKVFQRCSEEFGWTQ